MSDCSELLEQVVNSLSHGSPSDAAALNKLRVAVDAAWPGKRPLPRLRRAAAMALALLGPADGDVCSLPWADLGALLHAQHAAAVQELLTDPSEETAAARAVALREPDALMDEEEPAGVGYSLHVLRLVLPDGHGAAGPVELLTDSRAAPAAAIAAGRRGGASGGVGGGGWGSSSYTHAGADSGAADGGSRGTVGHGPGGGGCAGAGAGVDHGDPAGGGGHSGPPLLQIVSKDGNLHAQLLMQQLLLRWDLEPPAETDAEARSEAAEGAATGPAEEMGRSEREGAAELEVVSGGAMTMAGCGGSDALVGRTGGGNDGGSAEAADGFPELTDLVRPAAVADTTAATSGSADSNSTARSSSCGGNNETTGQRATEILLPLMSAEQTASENTRTEAGQMPSVQAPPQTTAAATGTAATAAAPVEPSLAAAAADDWTIADAIAAAWPADTPSHRIKSRVAVLLATLTPNTPGYRGPHTMCARLLRDTIARMESRQAPLQSPRRRTRLVLTDAVGGRRPAYLVLQRGEQGASSPEGCVVLRLEALLRDRQASHEGCTAASRSGASAHAGVADGSGTAANGVGVDGDGAGAHTGAGNSDTSCNPACARDDTPQPLRAAAPSAVPPRPCIGSVVAPTPAAPAVAAVAQSEPPAGSMLERLRRRAGTPSTALSSAASPSQPADKRAVSEHDGRQPPSTSSSGGSSGSNGSGAPAPRPVAVNVPKGRTGPNVKSAAAVATAAAAAGAASQPQSATPAAAVDPPPPPSPPAPASTFAGADADTVAAAIAANWPSGSALHRAKRCAATVLAQLSADHPGYRGPHTMCAVWLGAELLRLDRDAYYGLPGPDRVPLLSEGGRGAGGGGSGAGGSGDQRGGRRRGGYLLFKSGEDTGGCLVLRLEALLNSWRAKQKSRAAAGAAATGGSGACAGATADGKAGKGAAGPAAAAEEAPVEASRVSAGPHAPTAATVMTAAAPPASSEACDEPPAGSLLERLRRRSSAASAVQPAAGPSPPPQHATAREAACSGPVSSVAIPPPATVPAAGAQPGAGTASKPASAAVATASATIGISSHSTAISVSGNPAAAVATQTGDPPPATGTAASAAAPAPPTATVAVLAAAAARTETNASKHHASPMDPSHEQPAAKALEEEEEECVSPLEADLLRRFPQPPRAVCELTRGVFQLETVQEEEHGEPTTYVRFVCPDLPQLAAGCPTGAAGSTQSSGPPASQSAAPQRGLPASGAAAAAAAAAGTLTPASRSTDGAAPYARRPAPSGDAPGMFDAPHSVSAMTAAGSAPGSSLAQSRTGASSSTYRSRGGSSNQRPTTGHAPVGGAGARDPSAAEPGGSPAKHAASKPPSVVVSGGGVGGKASSNSLGGGGGGNGGGRRCDVKDSAALGGGGAPREPQQGRHQQTQAPRSETHGAPSEPGPAASEGGGPAAQPPARRLPAVDAPAVLAVQRSVAELLAAAPPPHVLGLREIERRLALPRGWQDLGVSVRWALAKAKDVFTFPLVDVEGVKCCGVRLVSRRLLSGRTAAAALSAAPPSRSEGGASGPAAGAAATSHPPQPATAPPALGKQPGSEAGPHQQQAAQDEPLIRLGRQPKQGGHHGAPRPQPDPGSGTAGKASSKSPAKPDGGPGRAVQPRTPPAPTAALPAVKEEPLGAQPPADPDAPAPTDTVPALMTVPLHRRPPAECRPAAEDSAEDPVAVATGAKQERTPAPVGARQKQTPSTRNSRAPPPPPLRTEKRPQQPQQSQEPLMWQPPPQQEPGQGRPGKRMGTARLGEHPGGERPAYEEVENLPDWGEEAPAPAPAAVLTADTAVAAAAAAGSETRPADASHSPLLFGSAFVRTDSSIDTQPYAPLAERLRQSMSPAVSVAIAAPPAVATPAAATVVAAAEAVATAGPWLTYAATGPMSAATKRRPLVIPIPVPVLEPPDTPEHGPAPGGGSTDELVRGQEYAGVVTVAEVLVVPSMAAAVPAAAPAGAATFSASAASTAMAAVAPLAAAAAGGVAGSGARTPMAAAPSCRTGASPLGPTTSPPEPSSATSRASTVSKDTTKAARAGGQAAAAEATAAAAPAVVTVRAAGTVAAAATAATAPAINVTASEPAARPGRPTAAPSLTAQAAGTIASASGPEDVNVASEAAARDVFPEAGLLLVADPYSPAYVQMLEHCQDCGQLGLELKSCAGRPCVLALYAHAVGGGGATAAAGAGAAGADAKRRGAGAAARALARRDHQSEAATAAGNDDVTWPATVYLVDFVAVAAAYGGGAAGKAAEGVVLGGLRSLLENPSVVKVAHGCEQVRLLEQACGGHTTVAPLRDTAALCDALMALLRLPAPTTAAPQPPQQQQQKPPGQRRTQQQQRPGAELDDDRGTHKGRYRQLVARSRAFREALQETGLWAERPELLKALLDRHFRTGIGELYRSTGKDAFWLDRPLTEGKMAMAAGGARHLPELWAAVAGEALPWVAVRCTSRTMRVLREG